MCQFTPSGVRKSNQTNYVFIVMSGDDQIQSAAIFDGDADAREHPLRAIRGND